MKPKGLLNLMGDRLHTLPLVVLYLTDGCNSRCVTCDIWRNPRRNMRMELVEQIAESCSALDTRWILLSGGEAMQHPRWPEIARRFRESGLYVMLLTNGLLLRKQADEVIRSVDEVIVSLDAGDAPTYEAIRGVDGFDLILDGIRAVRAGGTPVSTRTTVQRANYRQIPAIIDAAKTAGVNRVSFLTVDVSNEFAFGARFVPSPPTPLPQGEGRQNKQQGEGQEIAVVDREIIPLVATMGAGAPPEHGPAATALTPDDVAELERVLDDVGQRYADDFASGLLSESPEKLRRMVDYFAALNGDGVFPRPRCNSPHISTVIEVDGRLRPCYFLPTYGKLVVGSGEMPGKGEADTLTVAINLPEALALRKAYRGGERPECERCVCPLYKGPRALLRM